MDLTAPNNALNAPHEPMSLSSNALNAPHEPMSLSSTVVTLADSSSHLRNLKQRLSLVQDPAQALPQFNPVPPTLDDRLTAAFSKARKSALPPFAPDRIASEKYPIAAPPRHDFFPGASSRHIGRDPRVLWK